MQGVPFYVHYKINLSFFADKIMATIMFLTMILPAYLCNIQLLLIWNGWEVK